MHELSLLATVVELVEQAATAAGAKKVQTVALAVGTLSGAVPEALEGSWPIAILDHPLFTGAKLELHEIQATVYCPQCQRDVPIDEFFALKCPECGAPTANLTHGREFNVQWAEWEK